MQGLICAFSPAGDALAISTADGRIRTFDTGTGRLRVTLGGSKHAATPSSPLVGSLPNGHLAENNRAIIWAVGHKDKSKKKSATATNGIVIGTAAGDVKCYDSQLGELKWHAGGVMEGGVASVAFSPLQGGTLYIAGSSHQICVLDAETGQVHSRFDASKHPITCISLSPDNKYAFGGASTLYLWSLESQERLRKYSGHPISARAIAFSPDGRFAVSAASGERHVAVWSAAPAAKKHKKSSAAVSSLSLEHAAVQLDTCPAAVPTDGPMENGPSGSDASAFHVAAVSEHGHAYVWLCEPQTDGEMMSWLVARVQVGTSGSQGAAKDCILAAKLQAGTKGPSLLVAHGNNAKPVFEKVLIEASSSGSEPAVIFLQPTRGGLLLDSTAPTPAKGTIDAKNQDSKQKPAHTRNDVTVLGPENLGQPVIMRGSAAAAAVNDRKRIEPEAEEAGPVPAEEEVPDVPEHEVPLGARVAALEARSGEAGPETNEAGPSMQLPQGSSKADSLAVLLTQALRSNDRALLERCLSNSNLRIINNTVRQIVPMDAALFLRAAVDRVLSKPSRAIQLTPWIRAVLHHHTGYMMMAPGVQAPLTALYQAIDGRVGLYQQLLKVYGRLGLITAHAARRGAEGADADDGRPQPEVVFEDHSDAEEPDAEDPFAEGGASSDKEQGSDGDEGEDFDDDLMMGVGDDGMNEDGDFDDGAFSDEDD